MSRRRALPSHERIPSEIRATEYLLATALVTVPLFFDQAVKDTFRLPKEVLFNLYGVFFTIALIFVFTARSRPRILTPGRRQALALTVIIVAWCSLSTLLSANRFLSSYTLLSIVAAAVMFWSTVIALHGNRSLLILDIALIAPLINAVLVILQDRGIWQPFTFPPEIEARLRITALLGNPNDVGTFLVIPAVAVVVGAAESRGWRRALYAATGIILLGAMIASRTRTSLIAYAAGLTVAVIVLSRRKRMVVAVLLLIAIFAATSSSTTLRRGIVELFHYAKQRQYQVVFSERLPGFLAAIDMLRDHPIVGVGPGNYKWLYMRYRARLASHYDPAWVYGEPLNFREAHNDHLQVAAETGLPGYALLVAALFLIARKSSANSSESSTAAFAARFRFPLAVTIAVAMLAQFPLELAAPRLYIVFFAGLIIAWGEEPSHAQ